MSDRSSSRDRCPSCRACIAATGSSSAKKPGGCDTEIVVELENRTTRQRATFSFLMIFGKTRIDHGLVR